MNSMSTEPKAYIETRCVIRDEYQCADYYWEVLPNPDFPEEGAVIRYVEVSEDGKPRIVDEMHLSSAKVVKLIAEALVIIGYREMK